MEKNNAYISVKAYAPSLVVGGDNYHEVISALSESNGQVIVFPELYLTGATCGDAFTQTALLEYALGHIEKIIKESEKYDSILFFGSPLSVKGKVYDCVIVLEKGKVLGVVPKIAPAYPFAPAPDEKIEIELFDQLVPFYSNLIFNYENAKIGVEIGSDAFLDNPPSVELVKNGATIIVNPSVSKMLPTREEEVESVLSARSKKLSCIYVRSENKFGESTTDALFDGQNFIFAFGQTLAKAKPFNNELLQKKITVIKNSAQSDKILPIKTTQFSKKNPFLPTENINEFCLTTLEIQARGLCARLKMIPPVAKAIIGLSGGLDSCLALLVINRAFDILGESKKKIIAISMPCFGTSKRTKSNAQRLAEILGVDFREISIKESVLSHFKDIGHDPSVTDATYENSQARERTQVLMDTANKEGGMVIGTGDLSELALGWATYNGDQMSMYGVNASIPKTMVREIVRVYAQRAIGEIKEVLLDILATPVSPELLPPSEDEISQVTEDIIGPYELHDFFLYNLLVNKYSALKIYHLACEVFKGEYKQKFILKCLMLFVRRFFSQQFKRSCMPDGVQATKVSLSPRGGLTLPSDMKNTYWLTPLEEIEKNDAFSDEE